MVNKQNFWTNPSTDLKGHGKYFGKFGHTYEEVCTRNGNLGQLQKTN